MFIYLPAESRGSRGEIVRTKAFIERNTLHEPHLPFDSSSLPFAQKLLTTALCREEIEVGRRRILPAANDIRQITRRDAGIVAHLLDIVLDSRQGARRENVADLEVVLCRNVQILGKAHDPAVTITALRKISRALQPDALADVESQAARSDVDVVGRNLVDTPVLAMLEHVRFDGLGELLFGQRIVFVRHTEVPKNILIAGLRHQKPARQLRFIFIRPLGDDLELAALRVEVHLEFAAVQLSALERYLLDQTTDFIGVRVERQLLVLEVVDRKRIAVLAGRVLAADRADLADSARIDTRKCLPLVVLDDSQMGILLHVLCTAGQLEPGSAVVLAVDIATAADGEQAGEKFHAVGRRDVDRFGSVRIPERNGLAVFAPAQIDGHAVDPPFGFGRIGDFVQRLVAIGALVIDDEVLRINDLADLPVGRSHLPVDVFDHQRYLFMRRSRQGEDGVVLAVDRLEHQSLRQEVFGAVELDVVFPFDGRGLLGYVFLDEPVTLPLELHPVVHFQTHEIERDERQPQYMVRHHAPLTRRIIRRRHRQFQLVELVIDFQFHATLKYCSNAVRTALKCRLRLPELHVEFPGDLTLEVGQLLIVGRFFVKHPEVSVQFRKVEIEPAALAPLQHPKECRITLRELRSVRSDNGELKRYIARLELLHDDFGNLSSVLFAERHLFLRLHGRRLQQRRIVFRISGFVFREKCPVFDVRVDVVYRQ